MGKFVIVTTLIDSLITLGMLLTNKDNAQIDWTSFVAQGDAILDGIYDYSQIWGPNGQIAYFPGHAYLYAFLSYTGFNYSITASKFLWLAFHVISTYSLMTLVDKTFKNNTELKHLCGILFIMQFRLKYYLVMYMQNETPMMIFLQIAFIMLLNDQTFLSIVFFNLSLSFKVGVLMWLPGYLLILAKKRSIFCPVFFLIYTLVFQYIIALPFIMVNQEAFVNASLGLQRRLPYRYAQTYKLFVDEDFFYTKQLSIIAYSLILGLNLLFLVTKWTYWKTFFADIRLWPLSFESRKIENIEIMKILCISALIQAIFNFNFHPQFFLWFSPIYPFLLTVSKMPHEIKFIFAMIIEHGVIFSPYKLLCNAAAICQFYLLVQMYFDKLQIDTQILHTHEQTDDKHKQSNKKLKQK